MNREVTKKLPENVRGGGYYLHNLGNQTVAAFSYFQLHSF